MIAIWHDESADQVAIGNDMFVFSAFDAVVEQDEELNWSPQRESKVKLHIAWNSEVFSYEILDLLVQTELGEEPVTGTLLRALPVQLLLKMCVNRALFVQVGTDEPLSLHNLVLESPAMLTQLAANGPKPETLDWVARIYTLAKVKLDPPTSWVADMFGIPQRTASHWVKLARQRGHLEA